MQLEKSLRNHWRLQQSSYKRQGTVFSWNIQRGLKKHQEKAAEKEPGLWERRLTQGQTAVSLLRLLRMEVFSATCCFLEIVCQSITWGKLDPTLKKRCILGTPLTNLFLRGKQRPRNRSQHDSLAETGNKVLWPSCLWKQYGLQP